MIALYRTRIEIQLRHSISQSECLVTLRYLVIGEPYVLWDGALQIVKCHLPFNKLEQRT